MSEITKHALEDSLKVLLLRKPFNKITIGDLTKECGINRMTFYYHFTDMHHLLSWIILDEIHQLLLNTNIYPEGCIRLLYKMKEDQIYIMNVYHSLHQEKFQSYLSPMVQGILKIKIEEEEGSMIIQESDKEFIARFYSYYIVGLLIDWLNDDMRENPERLFDKMNEIMHGCITRALKRFEIHQN